MDVKKASEAQATYQAWEGKLVVLRADVNYLTRNAAIADVLTRAIPREKGVMNFPSVKIENPRSEDLRDMKKFLSSLHAYVYELWAAGLTHSAETVLGLVMDKVLAAELARQPLLDRVLETVLKAPGGAAFNLGFKRNVTLLLMTDFRFRPAARPPTTKPSKPA